MNEEIVAGRNSVLEALKSGRPINKILVTKGEHHGSLREIIGQARALGLVVQEVDAAKLDAMTEGVKHQGVVATVAPVAYAEIEDILAKAHSRNEPPFIILLDELEDPHNLGAILRTADASGAHGVLIPKRRSCPLSVTVAKTSAGAVEYVPVARVGNVAQTIAQLKKQGLWVVGADAEGDKKYYEADLRGPMLLVIGSEGQGLGRLTKEGCDFLVRIPMLGQVSSLNASVACSLLLYEVMRQRESASH
ncbi:MAG: 23S rRNA (guanosine(2251)-2'-O)-methyltransferase RlmB [Negativicutes bacterium]|nr:23S rRNA (guanosine(2251)-2'-O)-methyltransferase RlmB [Negativicutes bacterium]